MFNKILNINTNKIPYRFNFKSYNDIFTLNIKHNAINNGIYVDLIHNDETLIKNEKLIFGRPVGYYLQKDHNSNFNENFPNAILVPLSIDGETYDITLENLGKVVFLAYKEI